MLHGPSQDRSRTAAGARTTPSRLRTCPLVADAACVDRGDLRELHRYALAEPVAPRDRSVGERSGRRRQEGPEFVDYRPYVPGDDPRRVDWRVYARLGDLVVRSALAESHIDVAVMLDGSRSMAGKFRWSQRLAAM